MPTIQRADSAAARLADPQRETDISTAIRLALSNEPDLVLWRNSVGVFDVLDEDRGEIRKMRAGLPTGSSDLIGVLGMNVTRPGAPAASACTTGRFVALEVKRPRGSTSDDQIAWMHLVRTFGGFATQIRSVAEAREAIERARAGLYE